MDSNNKTTGIDRRVLFSTIWIVFLFNSVIGDIHGLLKPGFLEEVMTGTLNGLQMTPGFLLAFAVLMEIPTLMVLLSRVLKYRANRWANIFAAALALVFVLVNVTFVASDPDNIFYAIVNIVLMSIIVWKAWTWPRQEA